MLKLYRIQGTAYCTKEGTRFVNDRLLDLLESLMKEYVKVFDPSYALRIETEEDWEKHVEEIIDLKRLNKDEAFVTHYLEPLGLKPDCVSTEQVLYSFFSLYRLLKAKNVYEPTPVMEYILLSAINYKIESETKACRTMSLVMQFPREERKKILREMEMEVYKLEKMSPDLYAGSISEITEEFMTYYEDMRKYPMICFENTNCLNLDLFPERKGIPQPQTGEKKEFTGEGDMAESEDEGKHKPYRVNPWDMEEE